MFHGTDNLLITKKTAERQARIFKMVFIKISIGYIFMFFRKKIIV